MHGWRTQSRSAAGREQAGGVPGKERLQTAGGSAESLRLSASKKLYNEEEFWTELPAKLHFCGALQTIA